MPFPVPEPARKAVAQKRILIFVYVPYGITAPKLFSNLLCQFMHWPSYRLRFLVRRGALRKNSDAILRKSSSQPQISLNQLCAEYQSLSGKKIYTLTYLFPTRRHSFLIVHVSVSSTNFSYRHTRQIIRAFHISCIL